MIGTKVVAEIYFKTSKAGGSNSEFTKHEVVKLGIAASKVVVVYLRVVRGAGKCFCGTRFS